VVGNAFREINFLTIQLREDNLTVVEKAYNMDEPQEHLLWASLPRVHHRVKHQSAALNAPSPLLSPVQTEHEDFDEVTNRLELTKMHPFLLEYDAGQDFVVFRPEGNELTQIHLENNH